jgi:hypothetical protein
MATPNIDPAYAKSILDMEKQYPNAGGGLFGGDNAVSSKGITGNHVAFKINGKVIGMAQNVTFRDEATIQKLESVGYNTLQELVPGVIHHVITGEKFFVASNNLKSVGIMPDDDKWHSHPYFMIEVIDTVNNQTLESYTNCRMESYTRKYSKHSIVGSDFTIIAMDRKPG